MSQIKYWQIWVDTGGTFTDCICIAPNGTKKRIKVLSSAALRGIITKKIAPKTYLFTQKWNIKKDIFQAYHFRLLGKYDFETKVISINFKEQSITLANELPALANFEISANEEAPTLAARIATLTPLNKPLPPLQMRLGTTKGTNALLERKGAKVTLLITKGFKDLIKIGTQQRPHLFQLNIPNSNLLYEQVIEIEERTDAQGKVLIELLESEIESILPNIQHSSVAVACLHSYKNSLHEKRIQKALNQAKFCYISLSSHLSSSIKILPRATTALVNAYLHPILEDYLQRIRSKLSSESNLKVMTSVGSLVNADFFHPKDSLLSGPAGGVVGAAAIAKKLNIPKILTLDMGGTSTDTARFDGNHDYKYITAVGDAQMLSPCFAIETVAAGGGSLCQFDGEKLTVGPESAGAFPGPACYGAGGDLAITDINLLLGKLDASAIGIPIQLKAAKEKLKGLQVAILEAKGQQMDELEILRGFEQIANEKMAEAIREISVAKGFDTKDYSLLVFGGAGGLHACKIADLLQIEQIVLPFDGGLLSAYGMGMAKVERMLEQQILQPLEKVAPGISNKIEQLFQKGQKQLQQEGFTKEQIEIKKVLLYLRFLGQDSTLEIEAQKNIEEAFKEKYEHLFGHYPASGNIELESIKVIVTNRYEEKFDAKLVKDKQIVAPHHFLTIPFEQKQIPVYHWEKLPIGTWIEGEAILLNSTSTTFIETDWSLHLQTEGNAILQRQKAAVHQAQAQQEAIELELFTNRFLSIAEEMGAQLQRTAFSVNIKERLDFSCAILNERAELLVNAPHIPVHLGSLGICARLILAKFPLHEGDVIITNHPKYGGSHLPDVTLLKGVFDADNQLIGYVVNRAHHAEIGGKTPGSMPPDATNLEEEGVVILPTYLVKLGELDWTVIEDLLRNSSFPSRSIQENLADINAALASLKTGEEKLQNLVKKHSLSKVHHYMQLLQDAANSALQKAIQRWSGQTLVAMESLDDRHEIHAKITFQNTKIYFDFTNTSAPHPNNLNANISIVYSAIIYVLRLICPEELPLNEGLMQQVEVHLPESFLHPHFEDDPRFCPAVVGGNTEVSQRLVDTLLKAFDLAACSQGTMNNFLFGNEKFGYYETICGGTGAGAGFHGRSAIHQHMTNTKITDPEELEYRYPVHLQQFAIRENSGGKGKWQGGNGIVRAVEFLEKVEMTLITQHRNIAPYGKKGGEDGRVGAQYLIRANGEKEQLKGIDSKTCQVGDRVVIETPGGGGWGVANDI